MMDLRNCFLVAGAAAALHALPVHAQPQPGRPEAAHSGPVHGAPGHGHSVTGPLHLDQRYHHDHYYPGAGFTVGTLPAGSVGIGWHGGHWFFHGGVWFQPLGIAYVVAVPPVGLVVPWLPPAYVSLWIGGVTYYYANGVYYAAAPEGYVVVEPPIGAETAEPVRLPPTLVLYPRNGQTTAQTDADHAACNEWADAQPGASHDASLFQRGFEACMDGRGYTVR